VALQFDHARPGRFDAMRVDVAVELADGRRAGATCDGPPGIWGRPAAAADLQRKIADCLARAGRADLDAAALGGVTARDPAALRALIRSLGAPPA
jgi:aconitate decarboxylase